MGPLPSSVLDELHCLHLALNVSELTNLISAGPRLRLGFVGEMNGLTKRGILFSIKKEGNFDICYTMYEP